VTYAAISRDLREQLQRIKPSSDGMCEYRPCRVRLASGDVHDFVCVAEADEYIRVWGGLAKERNLR
jgi:hypothetical protein